MARAAVIEGGTVVNVIMLEPEVTDVVVLPPRHVVFSDAARIGDTHSIVGGRDVFTRPEPQKRVATRREELAAKAASGLLAPTELQEALAIVLRGDSK